MSIELGSETLTVAKKRRTWRVNIETPEGGDYTLTAHREQVQKVGDVVIARSDETAVTRALPQVAASTVTLTDGAIVSAAQIGEALERFIEAWDAEDRAQ